MIFELFPELWYGPILATFVWTLLLGSGAWLLVFHTPFFNRHLQTEFDSVLCTILNLIFVFFMAFMGSEFHANYKSATDNLVKEKTAVNRLMQMEFPTEAFRQAAMASLRTYLDAVVNVEWQENHNRKESAKAEQALSELNAIGVQARRDCTLQPSTDCMDAITASSYANAVDDLREARDYRLATGSLERQTLRYLLCMFLAFNATLSILALYRKDRRAAVAPIVMYCASVWVAFMIVVLHAEPYVGVRGIEPDVLEQMLQHLS